MHTFVVDVLPFNDVFVCEWVDLVVVVSVGAFVDVALIGLVIWSAGSDSGTVCSVDRIVVDILIKCTRELIKYFVIQAQIEVLHVIWKNRKETIISRNY